MNRISLFLLALAVSVVQLRAESALKAEGEPLRPFTVRTAKDAEVKDLFKITFGQEAVTAEVPKPVCTLKIPYAALQAQGGEATLDYDGVKWTLLYGDQRDVDFVRHPVVVADNAVVAAYPKRALPAQPDAKPIVGPIQYWTPHDWNSWVGDCAAIRWGGRVHVFYLYDRRHHRSKDGGGGHYFAHISSADLVHWTEHPDAVPPTRHWEFLGTGMPVDIGGKLHLFYGLHTDRYGRGWEQFPVGGTYAVSTDGIRFAKSDDIFCDDQNPSPFMRDDGRLGIVHSYCSTNAGEWVAETLKGPWTKLHDTIPTGGDCPFVFAWNGWRYVIQGFVGMAASKTGAPGTWEDWVMSGDDIYDGLSVPVVSEFGQDRRLLVGWIRHPDGWGGWLCFRELVQHSDGRLGTRWADEIQPPEPPHVVDVAAGAAFAQRFARIDGEAAELELRVDPKTSRVQFADVVGGKAPQIATLSERARAATGETFRARYLKRYQDSPDQCRETAIGKVRGLDRPYRVRYVLHYDPKGDTTIFDAEIAGGRTLLCIRRGKWIARESAAAVRPDFLFQSNLVIGRGRKTVFTGTAGAGETVSVKLRGKTYSAQAGADGRYAVTVEPLPVVKDPFDVVISSGKSSVTLTNVVSGLVLLAGGQSNMEVPVREALNPEEEAAAADYPLIREFKVEHDFNFTVQTTLKGKWTPVSPKTAPGIGAIGYYTARRLQRELGGIPVGIVNNSYSASPIEPWLPLEILRDRYSRSLGSYDKYSPLGRDGVLRRRGELGRTFLYQDTKNEGEGWGWHQGAAADWVDVKMPNWLDYQVYGEGADGAFWVAREFELTPEFAAKDLEFRATAIDDYDVTYLNGVKIGATGEETPDSYDKPRAYRIPKGLAKPGKNVIAIRIFDTAHAGGMPPEGKVSLACGEEEFSLAGPWKTKAEKILKAKAWPADYLPLMKIYRVGSVLYNAMFAPLRDVKVDAILWYQGESNAGQRDYGDRFKDLIIRWRRDLASEDAPFVFMQLAAFQGRPKSAADTGSWPLTRAEQEKALILPNVRMVPTIDIGDANRIHPLDKQEVGRRAALVLLQDFWAKDRFKDVVDYPTVTTVTREGNALVVSLRGAKGLKTTDGRTPQGFSVVGPMDKKTRKQQAAWAKARLDGERIVVEIPPEIAEPIRLRYAWHMNPDVNTVNGLGFPMLPFERELDGQDVAIEFDENLSMLISDIHIQTHAEEPYAFTAREFPLRVAEILAMKPRPRRVICFGDMTFSDGEPESYAFLRKQVDRLEHAGIRVVLGMGNHDRRKAFLASFPEAGKDQPVSGRIVHKVDLGHCDLILLDTLDGQERAVGGEIGAEQEAWLRREVAAAKRPVFLGAHHRPGELKVGGRPLLEFMRSSDKVVGWINGHGHYWHKENLCWGGGCNEDVIRSLMLPTGGAWGEIGTVTLRTYPDRAEAKLKMIDMVWHDALKPGEQRPKVYDAIVADQDGDRIVFPYERPMLRQR